MTVSLEVRDVAGVTVIAVRGDADLYTTPQIRQRIVGEIDGGARRLVVDLSDADLVDSTMLGVPVGAEARACQLDGRPALVAL